jgi:hypothetical protein
MPVLRVGLPGGGRRRKAQITAACSLLSLAFLIACSAATPAAPAGSREGTATSAAPTAAPEPSTITPPAALSLQSSSRALVWVRNRAYDSQTARIAGRPSSAGPNWIYEPPTMSGLTLKVSGLADGDYTARWYSPQTGAWLDESRAASAGGSLSLAIPQFSRDLAVKVISLP